MNKLVMGVAGLAILAAPLAASAEPYGHWREGGGWSHREGRDYGRRYDGDADGGGALVAGVAGLALGAALAERGDYGYGPAYGYAPSYGYDSGYAYGPHCYWRTQPYRSYYGEIGYRQVEVCR